MTSVFLKWKLPPSVLPVYIKSIYFRTLRVDHIYDISYVKLIRK